MAEPLTLQRAPFPTSAGLVLGLSVCMHAAAAIQLLFGQTIAGATFLLVGQFLLSQGLLRLYNGDWIFQDIRVLFTIFLFLYGAALPLTVTSGRGYIVGITGAAFMYATAFFALNVVFWWTKVPWRDVPISVLSKERPTVLNVALFLAGFQGLFLYAASRGVTFAITLDRGLVGLVWGQVWVVLVFVVNGLAMYMLLGWHQMSRGRRFIVGAFLLYFIVFQLTLGNRRDFLSMILFFAGVAATRRKATIRPKTVAIGLVAFAFMLALGILRSYVQNPLLIASIGPGVLLTHNEFVNPIQTLVYYVTAQHPFKWGQTYLQAPTLFIPRAFWPEKPPSLSVQFLLDQFGSTALQGYAYTPVTEAFINFAWPGPFLVFFVIGLLLIKLVRVAPHNPALYFLVFSLTLDINRGETAGFLYSFAFIGVPLWIMTVIARLKWAPRTAAAAAQRS